MDYKTEALTLMMELMEAVGVTEAKEVIQRIVSTADADLVGGEAARNW